MYGGGENGGSVGSVGATATEILSEEVFPRTRRAAWGSGGLFALLSFRIGRGFWMIGIVVRKGDFDWEASCKR